VIHKLLDTTFNAFFKIKKRWENKINVKNVKTWQNKKTCEKRFFYIYVLN